MACIEHGKMVQISKEEKKKDYLSNKLCDE